jgi:hypothetical protein
MKAQISWKLAGLQNNISKYLLPGNSGEASGGHKLK